VSEQKQLERLKENIDQIVRHDLKSPLATISGLANAIKEVGNLNDSQSSFLRMIDDTAMNGMQSLTTALIIHKIEAGKYNPDLSETDIIVSVASAINELSLHFSNNKKNIVVSTYNDFKSFQSVVNCEKYLLHTVSVNLL
jgi:K+-sensing histidine kinase KdpD